MESEISIANLIHKGGVFQDVEGSDIETIYRNISDVISIKNGQSSESIYKALYDREKILSTAVGRGVAFPHAGTNIVIKDDDQRICVCYLKTPIDMQAPDGLKVYVMFVLMTSNNHTHLQILSSLAKILRNESFRNLLKKHTNEAGLLTALNRI
ncbi:MAG: PTS sugar transporter subunit IIA [Treponema sp.]|jgi:PTS system nitrogen regulatory IIA component|nr:PTS sugar transporter subunit IIA [Treponema sp.]